MIGVAQHFFPEPAAGGEERVIGDEELLVIVAGCEPGVLEVAADFALVVLHFLFDDGFVFRLFAQNSFADDAFDIGIGKLHAHSESRL